MKLIDIDNHECLACKHHASGKCDTWCEIGEAFVLREDVAKAQVIDAELVKHAHFIIDGYEDIHCSNCQSILGYVWKIRREECFKDLYNKNKYCRYCGAKLNVIKGDIYGI